MGISSKCMRVGFFMLAFFCVFYSQAVAAPGDLDAAFGSGGKVITTDFRPDPSASSSAAAVAVQPDGKIVVTGITSELAGTFFRNYIILARYNTDGSLDQTFGAGGKVVSDIAGPQVEINAIALQPDGKILVAGTAPIWFVVGVNNGYNFVVVRFNANGSVDTGFGEYAGLEITDFSGGTTNDDGIYSMLVQPDGKIAVSGYSRQGSLRDFALARYNANGTLDNSFDTDGKLVTSFSSNDDEARALLLQPDGKLVAAGYGFSSTFDFALARYNVDGSLDNSFDSDGKTTLDFGGSTDQGRAAVLEPGGKIVVTGNARIGGAQPDMAIARFNPDGSPDTTFDGDGKNTIDFFALSDVAQAIVRQSNGKFVVGGYATLPAGFPERDFGLARFNSNGTIDAGFGTSGKVTTKFANLADDDFIRGLALQANGKIVAAGGGMTQPNSSTRLALARYLGDAVTISNRAFDFEGDGKTDISIFRPSVGEWWINRSTAGTIAYTFGTSSDKIVPADYTADGKTDVAVWRPSTGEWFILRSEDSSYYSFPFGASGDIPAPADFDGDNQADVGVFRPSTSTWYISLSSGKTLIQQFGANGDAPVVADYDGDGKSDIAIYRASLGQWWIQKSTNNSVIAFQFGNSTDKAVQGDYTGDAIADVAIWRPSTGEWFILRSEDYSYYSFPFGISTDIPAPGDYDGDGKFDAAVFRPSDSTWYLQRSTAGTLIQAFGITGDQPVPSAFAP